MLRVKICGNMNAGDAQGVLAAGADMIGFLVDIPNAKNSISPEQAKKIISTLPSGESVMVTVETDVGKIEKLARATGASTIQLHGDVSVETILRLKDVLPNCAIWKTIHVRDESAIDEVRTYEGVVDAILIDTAHKGEIGGTGKVHDWNISRIIRESSSKPVILAGGLNPENVAEAIATVKPYAVDVQTGVSNPDGSKNLEKVRFFIERAKVA